ncbi:MAG: GAF domain-containing protein [Demequina sp.]
MAPDSKVAGVYRAPMRSRRDDVPLGVAVERALTKGLCGFGGALAPPPQDLDDAIDKATAQHDERLARRIGRFAEAQEGAWVWTRDVDGWYWLGRLGGAWRYDASGAAAAADLTHVRPCRWLGTPVPDSRVPAGVLATFARGGRNWQQTHSEGVWEASARVWKAAQSPSST